MPSKPEVHFTNKATQVGLILHVTNESEGALRKEIHVAFVIEDRLAITRLSATETFCGAASKVQQVALSKGANPYAVVTYRLRANAARAAFQQHYGQLDDLKEVEDFSNVPITELRGAGLSDLVISGVELLPSYRKGDHPAVSTVLLAQKTPVRIDSLTMCNNRGGDLMFRVSKILMGFLKQDHYQNGCNTIGMNGVRLFWDDKYRSWKVLDENDLGSCASSTLFSAPSSIMKGTVCQIISRKFIPAQLQPDPERRLWAGGAPSQQAAKLEGLFSYQVKCLVTHRLFDVKSPQKWSAGLLVHTFGPAVQLIEGDCLNITEGQDGYDALQAFCAAVDARFDGDGPTSAPEANRMRPDVGGLTPEERSNPCETPKSTVNSQVSCTMSNKDMWRNTKGISRIGARRGMYEPLKECLLGEFFLREEIPTPEVPPRGISHYCVVAANGGITLLTFYRCDGEPATVLHESAYKSDCQTSDVLKTLFLVLMKD